MEQEAHLFRLRVHVRVRSRGLVEGIPQLESENAFASNDNNLLHLLLLPQIIDYGLILHPGSYLRELWNAMDMLVVSCAITSFAMDMM